MAKKNPFKQDPPALKKKEEKFGDQDGDNEVGEAPDHVKKVRAAEKKKGKNDGKKGKK